MATLRSIGVQLQNLIVRGVVSRAGHKYQVKWLGDRVTPPVENFQPQGLYFRAPVGSECAAISPTGDTANAVLIGLHKRSAEPTDTIPEGAGGLHYLGTFGVYLAPDGTVHLGGGVAASDFVALAAKVTTQLNVLKAAIEDAVPVPNDGGVALQAGIVAALTDWPGDVAATKVRAT